MPKIENERGEVVIRPGQAGFALFGAAFFFAGMAFQIGIPYAAFSGQGMTINDVKTYDVADIWPWFFFPVPFWAIGLSIVLYSLVTRFMITEAGVVSVNLFGKRTELTWHEITRVERAEQRVTGQPILRIHGADKTISLSTSLSGWTILYERMYERLKGNHGTDLPPLDSILPPLKDRPQPSTYLDRPQRYPYGGWFYVFFGIVWLFISGSVTILFLVSSFSGKPHARQELLFLPVMLAFVAIGLWLIATATLRRIEVSETGIEHFDYLGRSTDKLFWTEIVAAEYENTTRTKNGAFDNFLVKSKDRYLQLNSSMRKFPQLWEEIKARVPASARVSEKMEEL